MAIRKAVATGNWSATATWDGGIIPSLEDTVYANGYTVTIDQAIDLTGSTVDQSGSFIPGHIYEIVSLGTTNFALTANAIVPGTNATTAVAVTAAIGTIFQAVNAGTATTGTARRVGALLNYVNTPISVVTGGGFTMSGNHNITGAYIQAGSANCLTFTSTATSTLAGCRATGSAFNLSTRAISFGSTGTLTLDGIIALGGRVTGTTVANGGHAIENTSTGTIDIINASTLTGGVGGFAFALNNNSTGTVTVTSGTLNGGTGSTSYSINNNVGGSISITSSSALGAGNFVPALNNNGVGSFTITSSTLTAGTGTGAFAIQNSSTGSITITSSTITGGSGSTGHGIQNASTGTITVTTSTLTGGSGANAHGLNNASTGTIVSTGDITATNSAHGLASASTAASVKVSGSFIGSANGFAAIYASKFLVDPTPATAKIRQAKNGTSTYSDFFTADNALTQAAPADVRSGTVYADGNLTGTCAVPAAASVGFGVPVDATTGTAALTPASVWDHLLTAITTSSTIGALLKTNIDATISSRSTATTAGIADAVWDEVLNGATHNIASSAGRRLRILDDERIITDGQVVAAAASTVTLEPVGTLCVGQTIVVTDQDTGDKQVRFILIYDTGTNTATVDTPWCNIPTSGDEYQLTTVRDPLITRNNHPAGTLGSEIDEMYLIHGLKDGETLTVTPTSRTAGAIAQTISGDGTTTTTVSRD
jgi:hypothetical protein